MKGSGQNDQHNTYRALNEVDKLSLVEFRLAPVGIRVSVQDTTTSTLAGDRWAGQSEPYVRISLAQCSGIE